MLKLRLFTALVLALPLVAGLFYLSSPGVAVLFGLVAVVGAWEWSALAGLTRHSQRLLYTAALILTGVVGLFGIMRYPFLIQPVLILSSLWWIWIGSELLFSSRHSRRVLTSFYMKLFSGFFILIPAWLSVFYLHQSDPWRPAALLYLLVLVAVADTAAYFIGRIFGRIKLAPSISPGKTVEGAAGGLLVVMALAGICGTLIWDYRAGQLGLWAALAVLVALFSVLGDLAESKFKRLAGIKDSGHILPGHGGVLDRVDAFTAAAPIFALAWSYLPKTPA